MLKEATHCRKCGTVNDAAFHFCGNCGIPLNLPLVQNSSSSSLLALEKQIRTKVESGYRVIARTETSAQLVLPKSFDAATAIVLAIVVPALCAALLLASKDWTTLAYVGIGASQLLFIGYVLLYLGNHDATTYLYIDLELDGRAYQIEKF